MRAILCESTKPKHPFPHPFEAKRIYCRAFRIGAVFDNVDVYSTQSRWIAYVREGSYMTAPRFPFIERESVYKDE